MELTNNEIEQLLRKYNILSFDTYEMIDSSQGDTDIRHNYIIDKKYVLRINSAKVMSENRLGELNRLIKRYNNFGFKAPYFISNNETYLFEYKDCYCYISEYLDCEIANNVKDKCRKELIKERVIFVSKFAQKYKNYDLTDTMSMYSLFELSPYDQLTGKGIDEKQDNFNNLIADLNEIQEHSLSAKLETSYNNDRKELLSFYKELPSCEIS